MKKEEQTEPDCRQASFEKKVLDPVYVGQEPFRQGWAFAPILKNVIEKALEAEMGCHLDELERGIGNKRNEQGKKTNTRKVVRKYWACIFPKAKGPTFGYKC